MRNIKIILNLLTASSLFLLSLTSFAQSSLTNLHTSKHASNAKKIASATQARYQTEVHVLNNSSSVITVKVVGTSINDALYPNEVEDIFSDQYFDAVEVVLYDDEGYEFFREYVRNHTTVEVQNLFNTRAASGSKQSKVHAVIQK